jgi:hypothetical protein
VAIVIIISLVILSIGRIWIFYGYISLFVAMLLALVLGMLAYFLDYWPLFLYGLMMATTEIIWGIYGIPTGPIIEIVFGGTALFIGLTMMIRFLRKYSLPKEEMVNGL